MTRRASDRPAPDYGRDRNKWAGLVQLAHAAAASGAPSDLKALAEKALDAEACWENLAPYPRGLVCKVLARLAWAYARQQDVALRDRLAPLVIAAAGMVDELHAETAGEPSFVVEAAEPAEAAAPRLPYADR